MLRSKLVHRLFAVVLALAVWQTVSLLLDESILLASPFDVIVRLCTIWRDSGFLSSVWFSFSRIIAGFCLGLVFGGLLALLAYRFPAAETLLFPYMLTVKSVPVASFIIIALVWLSSSQLSVFISFLMVLPIIYTNLLSGMKASDKKLLDMAKVFGIPRHRVFLYVRLPSIMPFLRSACSLALGLAWKAGVAAEVIGIPDGSIGEMLYDAKVYFNTTDLFAWTAIIVLLSVSFEKLFLFALKRIYKRLVRL